MDSAGTAGYIGSHSGHVLGHRLWTMGNAMVSEARADHRACAPGNLHRMLLDVSHATASHRDLKSLLGDLAGLLRRVARFDRLALVLHDPERDRMRLHTIVSLEPTFTRDLELPVPESAAGLVWQTQRPLVVPRIDRETRFPEVRRILRAEGMRSLCILPLTTPLRRLGGLSFASQDEDAFSDADVEVLQELTSQVALAVDNTLHHETAQRAQQELASERDRLRLLLEVNNALVSNLEPRALFSAIATCLRRVVAHDYTSLAVYDGERNAFDMWALEFAGKGLIKEHMFVPVEGSPAGKAFTAGEPARFGRADLAALESDVGRMLLAEGIQSMCSVPLTVHDRRLGTLSIGRLGGEPFIACDAKLLASVANQIAFSVENALAFQEIAELKDKLAAEKVYLEDEIRTEYNFEEIIGESSALKRVLHQVETVAPTDSAVLLRGETGTGKELIARAIHDLSQRRERTFVKLNCAAIPTGLLESELFGHERGAFTGAIAQRIGRFELADRGTLFLDEVGDIPLDERLPDHASTAPRAAGGHSAACPLLRAEVRASHDQAHRDHPRGRNDGALTLCVAGKRAGARERGRARRHPDERACPSRARVGVPRSRGCAVWRRRDARSDRTRSHSPRAARDQLGARRSAGGRRPPGSQAHHAPIADTEARHRSLHGVSHLPTCRRAPTGRHRRSASRAGLDAPASM
ncbi:MAG: GAF domain-containing protein [Deltaproteobacteria bacterium]|nr:MAG: GAF domain-containing protein [Deltaproteobacteria bacterium]